MSKFWFIWPLRETVSKLLSLRKSILSSSHLSEFTLNLLSLDQRRTSCIVSWSIDAPNLGTISKTVVWSANFHMEQRMLLIARSLIITKKSHELIRVPRGIPAGTGLKSEKQSIWHVDICLVESSPPSWQQWVLLLYYRVWRSASCGQQDLFINRLLHHTQKAKKPKKKINKRKKKKRKKKRKNSA